MRKLASIQRIWKIEPIEDADNIELAFVEGWQVVVNKGKFKPMDLAVFFEIDSFLPIRKEFEFLRNSSYRKTDVMGEGFKLRTVKLRGKISQGLLENIETFPELKNISIELNQDVSELLGVRKWEIEQRISTSGNMIGELPYFIPHTDETRIQNEPKLLNEFENKEYYISTKMDGASHSIGVDEEGIHVTSHNYEYKDDGSFAFYNFIKERQINEKVLNYYKENKLDTFVIQGELCAPGIQKNRLKLIKPEWYVFTIMENDKRVDLDRMLSICKELDVKHVPIEERDFNLLSKYQTINDLLLRADGDYPNGGKKEGIVIRTVKPEYSELICAPLSMKVINNNYLLKNVE